MSDWYDDRFEHADACALHCPHEEWPAEDGPCPDGHESHDCTCADLRAAAVEREAEAMADQMATEGYYERTTDALETWRRWARGQRGEEQC